MLILHCTICSENYSGKEEWLGHLLEENHQQKSREEFLKRRLEKDYIGSFIAVYSNKSVASDKLLKHFSWEAGALMTDFVYWRESSRMGFFQFENEKNVKEVLSGIINKKEVCVGSYLLQVKSAADIFPFEWGFLLPVSLIANDEHGVSNATGREPSRIKIENGKSLESKQQLAEPYDFRIHLSPLPEPIPNTNVQGRSRIKIENDEAFEFKQELPEHYDFHQALVPATLSNVKEKTPFPTCLKKILKRLEVSEDEYKTMQLVREELQKIFTEEKENYTVHVCLLQTWSMKLKQNKKDRPFFLIQRKSMNRTLTHVTKDSIRSLVLNDPNSTLSKKLELSATTPNLVYSFKDRKKIGLSFKVAGCAANKGSYRAKYGPQIWEMINYLCQFNTVCKPLLAIIYHWANTNLIQIGERRVSRDPAYDTNDKYFILTLLVSLFLSSEGYIPTFKEILSQTRDSDKVYRGGINIGFTENYKFVSTWRKTNGICNGDEMDKTSAKKVFALASSFFLHYGNTLVEGEWIINSENGKMFKTEEILNNPYPRPGETEPTEATLLMDAWLTNEKAGTPGPDRIILTHPSNVRWFLKISNDPTPFEAMKTTGVKLTNFLSCKKSDRVGTLMEMLVV